MNDIVEHREYGSEATDDGSRARPDEGPLLTTPAAVARVRAEIVSFVRQRVEESGATGVVVPMSGGIDSTVTAAVAAEALPRSRVLALELPCLKTESVGTIDARTIATGLEIRYAEVQLQPLLDRFEEAIESGLSVVEDRTTTGNAIARLRMSCAYYAANAESSLVLGTANRSELLLGYFTKYGDGGADLYPLGDLYKTEVRALAPQVGLPQRIIAKEPTAGFWAGQTDAGDLGASYDLLDRILVGLVDRGRPPAVVDLELVEETANRHAESAHKRTVPPTPGVEDRTPRTPRSE